MAHQDHPWCDTVRPVCRCFGTSGPSTNLRNPDFPLKPGCPRFVADGGTSSNLREAKRGTR